MIFVSFEFLDVFGTKIDPCGLVRSVFEVIMNPCFIAVPFQGTQNLWDP